MWKSQNSKIILHMCVEATFYCINQKYFSNLENITNILSHV